MISTASRSGWGWNTGAVFAGMGALTVNETFPRCYYQQQFQPRQFRREQRMWVEQRHDFRRHRCLHRQRDVPRCYDQQQFQPRQFRRKQRM